MLLVQGEGTNRQLVVVLQMFCRNDRCVGPFVDSVVEFPASCFPKPMVDQIVKVDQFDALFSCVCEPDRRQYAFIGFQVRLNLY